MRLSSILPAVAVVLGAANGAAVDDSVVEPRQNSPGIELLRLRGVPTGGDFTGVGIPGRCQNLPRNINDFERAEAIGGFRCTIYTGRDCTGSTLTVGARIQTLANEQPNWRSWKCACPSC